MMFIAGLAMDVGGVTAIDLAIIVGYLVLTLLLGYWVARKATTLSDYLVGGNSLPWYAMLGSIIATETSAVTFLSVPGLTFADQGNFKFLQLVLGFMLGRCIATYWLLPGFFAGCRFSAYEVLRDRFGRSAQKTASMLFLVTRTVSDGLRLYLTAIVLSEMIHCSMTLAITLLTVVTLVYSASGGIKSIVWNDCLQLIIYLGGAVFALWLVVQGCEGEWSDWMARATEQGKFNWLDTKLSWQSENIWVGLVAGAFLSLATHGTDQMMVQRYLSAKSPNHAKAALLLSGPFVLVQFSLFLLVGIGLWAFYQLHPTAEPLRKDQAFAHFIVNEMPIGARGITLAAILSVAMSTLSSSVGSSASTFVTDLCGTRSTGDEELSSQRQRWSVEFLCKVATVTFGLLQLGVALIVAWTPQFQVESIINQILTVSGFAAGVVLGVFLLTIVKMRVEPPALLFGMVGALIITSVLVFAPKDAVWRIQGTLAAGVTATTTALLAWGLQKILALSNK